MIDPKNNICQNFSKMAEKYDQYAIIQKKVADQLLSFFPQNGLRNTIRTILEIGCGTGILTQKLHAIYPNAQIMAVDIAPGMIAFAQIKNHSPRINWILADAEQLPDFNQMDLIVSNATFQWFSNLDRSLLSYKQLLSASGKLVFSIFGPKTFFELQTVLSEYFQKDIQISASQFKPREEIEHICKSHFSTVQIQEFVYVDEFLDLATLLRQIKYTGTRGVGIFGNQNLFWTKAHLQSIETIYRQHFGNIKATAHVFFVVANSV